ncbi:MAG: LPXTG cell wall anchor domain-containing protein [Bacilli bacterium]|nr:LPXTG cell wall anchor domain-containing protein [Bacilli bacterium]
MKIKKSVLITVFIAIVLTLIGIGSVNAGTLTSGESYSYYANRHRNGAFVPYVNGDPEPLVFHVNDLIGTSIDAGVNTNAAASGNAALTTISNYETLAKVAYYWGVEQGYASDFDNNNYKFLVRANQYAVNAQSTTTAMHNDNWSSEDIARVQSMVETASNVTVPSTFTAYRGVPNDDTQNFIVWETTSFTAKKEYNCDSPSGFNNSIVKNGDTIIYDITWNHGGQSTTIIIKDVLSQGLTYVEGSANIGDPTVTKNTDGTTTLTWTTTNQSGTLTYSVKVEASNPCSMGINKVQNNASITVDNNTYQLEKLENPLPSKCYAPQPNDGYNGQKVKIGDDIKYQITLTNVKNEVVTATVIDIISKGLTYNRDAVVSAGQITNIATPEEDSKKNTKLQFTITLPARSTVVLSYSAKVNNNAAVKVLNNANVRYDNDRSVTLNQLENPIYTSSNSVTPTTQDDTQNNTQTDTSSKTIPAPDTGSNVLVLGIASGLALVGVGGYFIYKKIKKS